MLTADFDYDLPPDLIASVPLPDRAASRMMVVHRQTGLIEHRQFSDLPGYLLWDNEQLVRPLDDSRAGMTVKVPVNSGRDLGEWSFVTVDGAETLVRHGWVFRSV